MPVFGDYAFDFDDRETVKEVRVAEFTYRGTTCSPAILVLQRRNAESRVVDVVSFGPSLGTQIPI